MGRGKITDAVKSGRILVSDGAWGTFLHKKGLKPGECPELWNLENYEAVRSIAESYLQAGADMVKTNSFGANRFKLAHYGLSNKAGEINEAAAGASREAAGENTWVIASMGPTGKLLLLGDVTTDELYDAFREQAQALEKGGADAVCIETMSDAEEARAAILAVRENTSLEILCTFTYEKTIRGEYRTMMGLLPTDATQSAVLAGADIVGANCGNGFERMIEVVTQIRLAEPVRPLLVHANAGMPVIIDGKTVFPDTPETMALLTAPLLMAGANIVGGCCGTNPEHIRAIKEAVVKYISSGY